MFEPPPVKRKRQALLPEKSSPKFSSLENRFGSSPRSAHERRSHWSFLGIWYLAFGHFPFAPAPRA
jgi:hypothetical protein